jgi:Xaa-Pro aminopeptidase
VLCCTVGIGHGVGAALNVHEGPQRISRILSNTQPLLPHMVVSIEPGYYKQDCFGIRLENLYEIVPVNRIEADSFPSHAAAFLKFKPLTLAPFQHKLIDVEMLENRHIEWINAYHKEVHRTLTSVLTAESAGGVVDAYADIRREDTSKLLSPQDVAEWISNECREI